MTDPTLDEQIAAVRATMGLLGHVADHFLDGPAAAVMPGLRAVLADLEATRPAPLPDGEPSPEALQLTKTLRQRVLVLNASDRDIARALDAFARSKVEKERARAAKVVDKWHGSTSPAARGIRTGEAP
jgi:hypothetical protein